MNPNDIPLGKIVTYSTQYDPELLFAVDRKPARKEIGIEGSLPFYGEDVWTAYELSWLNSKGKPVVAIGEIIFPHTTTHIIESKSLKLYCNSFNQTRFASFEDVRQTMEKDLSVRAGGEVRVQLLAAHVFEEMCVVPAEGHCIDDLDIEIAAYEVQPELLKVGSKEVKECLHSHLLRTNCPVTGQPDWATVVVEYQGQEILPESLLAYIVSYRQHTGFHENCVETLFVDIMHHCKPQELRVYARFTRRGGIDINPYRSTQKTETRTHRLARQ